MSAQGLNAQGRAGREEVRSDGSFAQWRLVQLQRLEQALCAWLEPTAASHEGQRRLLEAMRYGVLSGGKRLRALLVLAASEAVQGCPQAAMRAACAVEMVHAYSLIHDDMPCMDDDVLRRGKPTVHVAFGQAQALLAGDALHCLAFELLTPECSTLSARTQATLSRLLSRAAGHAGMVGGQAIDLMSVGKSLSYPQLRQMHELKTGALLQAAVMMGCATAEAVEVACSEALRDFGATVGLAFQVVDDILDATQSTQTLGKTAGKDAACDKPTYVSVMGLEQSRQYAQQLLETALRLLDQSTLGCTHALRALAQALVQRQF